MGGKDDKPGLTPEEKNLWQHVTRQAQPLKKDRLEEAPPAAPPAAPVSPAARPAAPKTAAPPKVPPPALAHGTRTGLDKRNAERLQRGQMTIEATLDLHGHKQATAHRALDDFLARAQHAGKRCVLVITGKGRTREEGGVLRSEVPRWLNEPANRARILAFDYAQPRHGGSGALYVLLKRLRG